MLPATLITWRSSVLPFSSKHHSAMYVSASTSLSSINEGRIQVPFFQPAMISNVSNKILMNVVLFICYPLGATSSGSSCSSDGLSSSSITNRRCRPWVAEKATVPTRNNRRFTTVARCRRGRPTQRPHGGAQRAWAEGFGETRSYAASFDAVMCGDCFRTRREASV